MANINPDKNFNLLINIIKNIEDKNIRFKIVGKLFQSQKKYFRNKLLNFRGGYTHKIEWVNDINDTKEIMNSFDILLCTSSYESLPLSIIEALSMSVPIISTNVGDITCFKSKKCGIIVKPFASDFIKGIYNLKNNQELKNIFSKNARDNVVKNFNIKNYKNKIEKEFL